MRHLPYFLLILIACEESEKVSSRSALGEVEVKTKHSTYRELILPNETKEIQTHKGQITVVEGAFEDLVVTEVSDLENGEGIVIDTMFANSNDGVPVPLKDIEICIEAEGDVHEKDIKATSAVDQSVIVSDGIVIDSGLCIFTQIVSGSFQIIDEENTAVVVSDETSQDSRSDNIQEPIALDKSNSVGSLSLSSTGHKSHDKALSENIFLTENQSISGALEISWVGEESLQESISKEIIAEVCLDVSQEVQTITQIQFDGTFIHHIGNVIDNSLCIE